MSRKEVVKVVIFLLVISSVSALLFYLQNRIGLEKIREIIIQAGPLGPVVFIFLLLLTYIFAPLQGTPFYFLSFALFGKWTLIYTHITYLIAAFINFWIARKFGRNIVIKLVGKDGMAKIDHIATHEGVKALIIMRLFYGLANDFVSYAAGFTSMKFRTYYLISLIVPIPYTVGLFLFFNKIPQEQVFFVSLGIGIIFVVIPPVYYFLKHRFYGKKILHKT